MSAAVQAAPGVDGGGGGEPPGRGGRGGGRGDGRRGGGRAREEADREWLTRVINVLLIVWGRLLEVGNEDAADLIWEIGEDVFGERWGVIVNEWMQARR